MTLDEMISDCLKVAEAQCKVAAELWDHRQLAEWLRELKELRSLKSDYVIFRAEAKKLLRLAAEGFENIKPYLSRCDGHCNNCPFEKEGWCCIDWKYAEEAEKLFKEE